MAEARKPTPAQRQWLRDINTGHVVRDSHSWVEGLYVLRVRKKSTFTMTLALHDAGWIEAKFIPNTSWRYSIHLTEAGRAAIGLPATPSSQGGQP